MNQFHFYRAIHNFNVSFFQSESKNHLLKEILLLYRHIAFIIEWRRPMSLLCHVLFVYLRQHVKFACSVSKVRNRNICMYMIYTRKLTKKKKEKWYMMSQMFLSFRLDISEETAKVNKKYNRKIFDVYKW